MPKIHGFLALGETRQNESECLNKEIRNYEVWRRCSVVVEMECSFTLKNNNFNGDISERSWN